MILAAGAPRAYRLKFQAFPLLPAKPDDLRSILPAMAARGEIADACKKEFFKSCRPLAILRKMKRDFRIRKFGLPDFGTCARPAHPRQFLLILDRGRPTLNRHYASATPQKMS